MADPVPTDSQTLLTTALIHAHERLKARLVPFAGYRMPVQYDGIMAEAKAVREGCGMFDVSHMGRLAFAGGAALEFLERATTNDVSSLPELGGQYSLLPNYQGGCVDDIILYRLEGAFQMVVNASNHEKALHWFKEVGLGSVGLEDVTDQTAMIAVQGPRAETILSHLSEAGEILAKTPAFGVVRIQLGDATVQAARSGYTGEDGFELICSADAAEGIWNLLLEAGVTPCGLGARDTLRLEAGLPLYGHELSDVRSPIEAGLGWVISKTKEFIGSDKIAEVRAIGPKERLVGVRFEAKRLIEAGSPIGVEGETVGSVTSGIVSPTFNTALALGYVKSDVKLGVPCSVEVRGSNVQGTICNKRFYKRS